MRIGIDATSVLDERSGVEGHVFAAVEALAAETSDELVVFVRRRPPERWAHMAERLDLRSLATDSQALATQVLLPLEARRARVDVLYCPAKPPAAAGTVRVLDAIHDVVPWTRPETMGRGAGIWYRTFDTLAVRRGAHIATGSDASASEIRRVLPRAGQVHVIGHALPPWLAEAAAAPDPERPAIAGDGDYLLSVCRIEPRKDLGCVLDAWDMLRHRPGFEGVRLVLAGRPAWKVGTLVERAGATPSVVLTGWVDEADLPGLYAHAMAFVTASREEGFGLPVLEAMTFGTPVVASAIPPHEEVAAGAGVHFPVGDARTLATAIGDLLADPEAAERLRRAGRARAADFSAAALARRLRSALESAAA